MQLKDRMDEAIASFNKALKIKPDFAQAHNSLGIALRDQGRLDEAIASIHNALRAKPEYAQAHNNLGAALKDQDRLDEAIASYGKALQLKPDYAEALNNLGIALQSQGRLDEAIASYGKALQLKPNFAEAHSNLGTALKDHDRLDEAIASIGKALQIKPGLAEAHNNLGIALKNQGRMEEAIASYGNALQARPGYVGAYSNLCELYEKQNNLTGLEKTLERATFHCGEDNSDILFRRAQLAYRKNQFDEAAGYLTKVRVDKLQPTLKPEYFSLLGKTCDRLDRFKEAFAAFEEQNALSMASTEARKYNAAGYLNSILLRKEAWTTDVRPIWPNSVIGVEQTSPAFLVGFPRSGTTLLDTILRSHPRIKVVEEIPMVAKMSKVFGRPQTIQNLNALTELDIAGLRDAYFKELGMRLDQDDTGKLIIDKLPLNIADIGLIHRVFPDAKFILALRHPCDCVLSCFMQTFELNDAMANFLSLDQSAKLYAAVMGLYSLQRQKLKLDVHVLKYEDLIQDFESTCKSLVKFLGLEWDDNLRNYQRTALGRTNMKTPSYHQVIQPLYKQASGRWKNYRQQMRPVLPLLQPWIKTLGYK